MFATLLGERCNHDNKEAKSVVQHVPHKRNYCRFYLPIIQDPSLIFDTDKVNTERAVKIVETISHRKFTRENRYGLSRTEYRRLQICAPKLRNNKNDNEKGNVAG